MCQNLIWENKHNLRVPGVCLAMTSRLPAFVFLTETSTKQSCRSPSQFRFPLLHSQSSEPQWCPSGLEYSAPLSRDVCSLHLYQRKGQFRHKGCKEESAERHWNLELSLLLRTVNSNESLYNRMPFFQPCLYRKIKNANLIGGSE